MGSFPEMQIYEAIVLLVLQLGWKNILVLNAGDNGCNHLIHLLNENRKPATLVGYDRIEDYPWPGRQDFRPRPDGFLMTSDSKINVSKIIISLQKKHVMNNRNPWLLAAKGDLCLNSLVRIFDEGDKLLVLGEKVVDSSPCQIPSLPNGVQNALAVWSLRSPGNGSVHFEKHEFRNTTDVKQLFDVPFRNFGGRTLRISSLASPPIRIPPEKESGKWGGYIFQIINTLAEFLNFTYVVKEAEGRLYGMDQGDGTWTGMIGELINKSVDLGVGDLSWTLDRFLVVDLTHPIFPETVTFIYRAPDFYSRTWIVFQGIGPKVCIGMTSTTIAAFAAYFLSLTLHQIWGRGGRVKDPASVCVVAADESISTLYRALLGKGVIHVPIPVSCRIVLGVWFGGALILSALYGGSLTSKLSLHKSPKPADSLTDLLKRHPNAMLALNNNSQIHQHFKMSKSWHKVWMKNMEKYVIPGKLHIEDTMAEVHRTHDGNTPYVWIAERTMLVKMMQNYSDNPVVCDLYVAKDRILKSDWALALQRNSPFLTQFNIMIIRMKQLGLFEKWRRDFWESASGSCHPSDGLNQSAETPISLADTRALFFVLAIGWMVGVAILVIERKVGAKPRRKRKVELVRMDSYKCYLI